MELESPHSIYNAVKHKKMYSNIQFWRYSLSLSLSVIFIILKIYLFNDRE